MSGPARTMLSFPVGASRFNYRVAAVAIRDGHVLVCHEDDDDYVMLPGGRVEMGEASPVALAREIAEELHSTAEIDRLLFTVENFFGHAGETVHEIGLYYAVNLSPQFPFRSTGVVLETEDEGHLLQLEWVPIVGDGLRTRNLLPPWLIDKLAGLPAATEHLIVHELRR
jgi:8-oxo-dGTP pyrophosphatase MutT (NUDIX family)